jgi:hypothetical protein
MDTLIFDPESKTVPINIATLDKTIKMEDAGGKLTAACPIHHSDLIKRVVELSNTHLTKYEPIIGDIVIKKDNCKRIMWTGLAEECPVDKYLVERLVMKIQYKGAGLFKDEPDAKGTMAVGISYTEKGIQMAFGHNVSVCQNLNVFGERVFSTYGGGNSKMAFDKGMQMLEGWLRGFDDIRNQNESAIKMLMERPVTEKERLYIFGKIYEMAIRKNAGDNTIDPPLNVTECNKMVAAGFDRITTGDTITAWNLTNWATSVLKPESSDMLNLLTKNSRLNSFLVDEFKILDSAN